MSGALFEQNIKTIRAVTVWCNVKQAVDVELGLLFEPSQKTSDSPVQRAQVRNFHMEPASVGLWCDKNWEKPSICPEPTTSSCVILAWLFSPSCTTPTKTGQTQKQDC